MGQAVGRGVNPQCPRSGAGGITWDAVQHRVATPCKLPTHMAVRPSYCWCRQSPKRGTIYSNSSLQHGGPTGTVPMSVASVFKFFSVKFWTDRLWSLGILQTFQKQLAIFLQSSKQICYSSKWDVTKSYRFNALENGTPPIHSEGSTIRIKKFWCHNMIRKD